MQIFKSGLIHKAGILVLALVIVVLGTSIIDKNFHFFSKISQLPGEVAGVIIVNDPGKFLPFVSLVGATATAPYQNVSGDVSISGNVGIGTAGPGAKLHIESTTTNGWIRMSTTSGNPEIVSTAGLILKSDSTTNQMYIGGTFVGLGFLDANSYGKLNILSNGSVGIGTAFSEADTTGRLNVRKDGTKGVISDVLTLRNHQHTMDNTGTGIGIRFTQGYDTETGKLVEIGSIAESGWSNAVGFFVKTGNSERMRITNAGSVGIGTAAPGTKLDVAGSINATGAVIAQGTLNVGWYSGCCPSLVIDATDPGTGGGNIKFKMTRWGGTWSWQHDNGPGDNFTTQMSLDTNGNLWVAGAMTPGSSKSLKKDINSISAKDYQDILNKALDTNVVRFRYKTENETDPLHLGVIAEDAPDEITTPDKKAISVGDYLAFLLTSIKSQQTEIDQLKEEIEQLKAK